MFLLFLSIGESGWGMRPLLRHMHLGQAVCPGGRLAAVRGAFTIRRGVQPVCTSIPLDIASESGNMLVFECAE